MDKNLVKVFGSKKAEYLITNKEYNCSKELAEKLIKNGDATYEISENNPELSEQRVINKLIKKRDEKNI